MNLTLTTKTDVVSSTVTYVGKAAVGSLSSDSVWRIFRITTDANGGISIEYVNGVPHFNFVWDNRASYTYS